MRTATCEFQISTWIKFLLVATKFQRKKPKLGANGDVLIPNFQLIRIKFVRVGLIEYQFSGSNNMKSIHVNKNDHGQNIY